MGCGRSKEDPTEVTQRTDHVTPAVHNATNVPAQSGQQPPQPEASPPVSKNNNSSESKNSSKLPPLAPPRKTRDQLIPDPSVFREVDDFVSKVSQTAVNSVGELARVLTKSYDDDLRKFRALFTWVALNIRYDTESFFSGQHAPQSADAVLQSGRAVCQGYAQLFQALCQAVGLPCLLVSGIAKGYGHDPEDEYSATSRTNHAWNLVHVRGEWRPLESTWGSGHVDRSGTFVRCFGDRYFLTDPGEFVLKHFPLVNGDLKESAKYQLLKPPITLEQFSARVKLEAVAHDLGLVCLTHQQTVIKVVREVTVKVKAERQPLESVDVKLTERGSNAAVGTRDDVLTSLDDAGTCTIYVRPSRAATYLLEIMGRGKAQEANRYHQLLAYVLRCKEPSPDALPFPDKHGVWGLQNPTADECGIRLLRTDKDHHHHNNNNKPPSSPYHPPFLFPAKNGQATAPIYFDGFVSLKTQLSYARPDSENDAAPDLEPFTFIEYTDSGARISARLARRGYYLLRVFSSHPSRESLHPVADLLLLGDGEFPAQQPYPQAYSTAGQLKARLISPLVGTVPRRETTVYRVSAPSLGMLTVAGKKMDLKNDGVWEAAVAPPEGKNGVTIFGAEDKSATSLSGLFKFSVEEE